jgi:hypothetical protein
MGSGSALNILWAIASSSNHDRLTSNPTGSPHLKLNAIAQFEYQPDRTHPKFKAIA